MKKFVLLCVLLSLRCAWAIENSRADYIEDQLRRLSGQQDELERKFSKMSSKFESISEEFEKYKNDISQALKNVENNNFIAANSSTTDNPADLIQKAKTLIASGKTTAAIALLENFLNKYKKNIYRGQAYFYIGEAHFKDARTKDALASYAKAYEENSKSEKAPMMLCKMANCFIKIGKIKDAKIIIEKVKKDYPNIDSESSKILKNIIKQV